MGLLQDIQSILRIFLGNTYVPVCNVIKDELGHLKKNLQKLYRFSCQGQIRIRYN
jgi:hypothetical protein